MTTTFFEGDRVRNQYGEIVEVVAVNLPMVTTWHPKTRLTEEYHHTKLAQVPEVGEEIR